MSNERAILISGLSIGFGLTMIALALFYNGRYVFNGEKIMIDSATGAVYGLTTKTPNGLQRLGTDYMND